MAELTRRYIVAALSTEGPFDPIDPDGPFVLKPWKDPAALRALEVYRDSCYPELARELSQWIEAIRSGPTVRGGVGTRNEPYAVRKPVARPASKKVSKVKGKPKRAVAKAVKKKGKRR